MAGSRLPLPRCFEPVPASTDAGRLACQPKPLPVLRQGRRLVVPTGLEPVTPWLSRPMRADSRAAGKSLSGAT